MTKQELIMQALGIMGQGMLGIFIALSIIYIFIVVLTKALPRKSKKKQKNKFINI